MALRLEDVLNLFTYFFDAKLYQVKNLILFHNIFVSFCFLVKWIHMLLIDKCKLLMDDKYVKTFILIHFQILHMNHAMTIMIIEL
jgi:hypothetical protein